VVLYFGHSLFTQGLLPHLLDLVGLGIDTTIESDDESLLKQGFERGRHLAGAAKSVDV